jgi:hypothetical protein
MNAQLELDQEIRHVRGLVFIRKLLAQRGAEAAELAECDEEIARQRVRLAALARRASAPYAHAA